MSSPLAGVRVIDLSRVLAGPQCTSMLGDLGADVVKVESVDGGDETRSWAPWFEGESTAFMSVNRNKRAIAIDLGTPSGRDVLHRLLVDADVVVENFRTGTAQRWGIAYDQLAEQHPRLVYASISAFGRTGELGDQAGYEAVLQAFSGIMSITGDADGMPARSGPSLLDIGTGIVTAHAILAALYQRERTGRGQLVESSLLGTAITFLGYHAQGFLSAGELPQRLGSGHPALVPYRAYPCAAGEDVFVAAGNQSLWERFCSALGWDDLPRDARFVSLPQRREHRAELDELLSERLGGLARADVLARLAAAGVPAAPVNDVGEVVEHPQVREVEAVQRLHHDGIGRDVDLVSSPFRASEIVTAPRLAPPRHGQHTTEILGELGFTAADQQRLHETGAVR